MKISSTSQSYIFAYANICKTFLKICNGDYFVKCDCVIKFLLSDSRFWKHWMGSGRNLMHNLRKFFQLRS